MKHDPKEEMMMKKLISTLLLLCLLVTVFPLSAFAADYTPYATQVVVNKGDTVSALCRARGLDYDSVQTAILILNGYAKTASLNAIRPGQVLYLPKSAEDAKAIVALHAQEGPANAIQYTVKSGDTIFSICTALRINYSANKEEIKKLNNWTSDNDLSKIYVGQKIYFPMTTSTTTQTATTGTATTATTTTTTTQTTTRNTGDTLEYYIVTHKMERGETVNGVCDALGAKYSPKVSDIVKALNNLTNLSSVQAGKEYYFPSTSPYNASYALYSHTIVPGDTTSKLCTAYGVKYDSMKELLERLNPSFKLTSIPVGKKITLIGTVAYVPAPSTPAPTTPTPTNTTPATTTGYNGNYQAVDQRATIEITGTAQASSVKVHWAGSAYDSVDWIFTGAFNESGLLQYSNCAKSTTHYTEAGAATKTINYQNGTGWLYFVNGALYWYDNQENAGNGFYFTRVK